MEKIKSLLVQAGQLLDTNMAPQAREIYLSICEIQDHPEARLMLGAIEAEQGSVQGAITHIKTAIKLDPEYAEAYVTLGSIYQHIQQYDDAHQCFLKATELDELYEEAWQFLGASYGQKGDYQNAEKCARRALEIDPSYYEPKVTLANSLKSQGRLSEAIPIYEEITLDGRCDKLSLQNLASSLFEDGQLAKSVEIYRRLLEASPGEPEILMRLAEILHIQSEFNQAESLYKSLLELNQTNVQAITGLAMVMADKKNFSDAKNQFKNALNIKPDEPLAQLGLAKIYYSEGCVNEAVPLLDGILKLQVVDNSQTEKIRFEVFSIYIFCLNYIGHVERVFLYNEHIRWAKEFFPDPVNVDFVNNKDEDKVLRIGYLSPDFRRHSVAFFVDALLSKHNRKHVEVFCYSNTKSPDVTTEYLQGLADHWRDISSDSDENVVQTIRNDQVDILVDLAGHTTNNRLKVFAEKAAPLQVSYLGYPNTTGLSSIDYRITDSIADPAGSEDAYSEELVRMPETFLCFSAYAESPGVSSLPATKNGYITFGSFNTIQKITPEVIRVWSVVLNQVRNSRVILKNPAFAHQNVCDRIHAEFNEQGIVEERVQLHDLLSSYKDHMEMYGSVDIALDTFPYNGTTTTCEALWMGVPVITFTGEMHAGRVGASILSAISCQEWIADTLDAYVQIAADLAKNTDQLAGIRTILRDQMASSVLCDATAFATKMEAAYRDMWQKWCAQQS